MNDRGRNGLKPTMASGGLWIEPVKGPKSFIHGAGNYEGFYVEIKPLLIGLSVVGKIPFKRTQERKCEFSYMSWHFAYWMAHYVVLTAIGVEQLFASWHDSAKEEVDFSSRVEHGVTLAVILILHLPTPLCILYERKALMELIDSWPPLLEQLENTLGEKFTARYSSIIKIMACLNPLLVVGIVLTESNLYLRGKYWRLLFYVSVFQASHYLSVVWIVSCIEMKNIAKKIQNAIEKIQRNRRDTAVKHLDGTFLLLTYSFVSHILCLLCSKYYFIY